MLPPQLRHLPRFRYMGSKYRLLPWLHSIVRDLPFDSALDGFTGAASVAYLFKAMGKRVVANDFLRFSSTLAKSLVENSARRLGPDEIQALCRRDPRSRRRIERMFRGIFYTPSDLRFLDAVSCNIPKLGDEHARAVAWAALFRACVKRQPRGVFTVAGDPERYKDGRRDLRLSVREQFLEQVAAYNAAVFDNGRENSATHGDIFDAGDEVDLVYLDPPYVPRADDNCYVKRYHFLEGLASYWDGLKLARDSRVKKLAKRYTPFSYRREAAAAFERLFERFSSSILVLSYSSNGFPDLQELVRGMRRHKSTVVVHEREHRYHFGTHAGVRRASAREYLIVGR